MKTQHDLHDDLLATMRARQELPADHEEALVQGFLERLDRSMDARLSEMQRQIDALSRQPRRSPAPVVAVVPIALGIGIPLSAIAAASAGFAGLLVVWAAILTVVYLTTR